MGQGSIRVCRHKQENIWQFIAFSLLATVFFAICGAIIGGADTSGFTGFYSDVICPVAMAVILVLGFGISLISRYRALENRQPWQEGLFVLPFAALAVTFVMTVV